MMMHSQQTTRQRPAATDALARFFLERLSSLAARQASATSQPERTALAQAVFSTYLDCLDLGLEDEAQEVLTLKLAAMVERSA